MFLRVFFSQDRFRSASRAPEGVGNSDRSRSATVVPGGPSSAETSPFHRAPVQSRPSVATSSFGVGQTTGNGGGGSLTGSFGSTPWTGPGQGSATNLNDSASAWILPPQLPPNDDRALAAAVATAAGVDADDRGSMSGSSEQLGRIQFHLSYDFQVCA